MYPPATMLTNNIVNAVFWKSSHARRGVFRQRVWAGIVGAARAIVGVERFQLFVNSA